MINFPTSLDTITNPDAAGGDTLLSVPHDAQHGTANDILEALEAKVGADSSVVEASHDYLLAGLETDKADVAQTMYIGTTAVAINRGTAALTLAGLTLTTPDIGTPSAGTLTNCTFPTLNQNTTGTAANLSGTPTLPNGTLATTQGASDNSTKLATTAYVDAAGGGGGATQLSELSDVVSATNTDKFALMANGTTGYVGRALVEADISNLGSYITISSSDTLTNKTIDGDVNTLSDIAVSSLKEGTDGQLITWGTNAEPTTVATGDNDQVLTSNGAGAAPTFQDAAGGGFTYDGTEVFNSTSPDNAWVELDLSSYVGAARHLVLLKVETASNISYDKLKVNFRPDEDADYVNLVVADKTPYGSNTCWLNSRGTVNAADVMVMTSSAGKIEWSTEMDFTVKITLLGYL